MTSAEEQQICLDCRFCCKYMVLHNHQKDPVRYQRQVEFQRMWGFKVLEHGDGVKFETIVPYSCRHLAEKGCDMYEERPTVCRQFNGVTESAIMQRNCELFKIRLKKEQNAKTGDSKAKL